MTCRIDHITITSQSLEAGSEFVFNHLGVRPQKGGEHPRMGTHNLLLRLGEAMFLEVIAVNPAAEAPSRPRWFELDKQPAATEPRLACWVARVDDIHAAMANTTEALGAVEPMSRGALEWLISIPEGGGLPLGGAAPALIQWHAARHPASGLQDQGCRLVALELLHPEPARVSEVLRGLALAEPDVSVSVAQADAPTLVAHIRTPRGLRTIGAPRVERPLSFRPAAEADLPFLLELRSQTMTAHQLASGMAPSDEERDRRVRAGYEWAQVILQGSQPIGLLKVVREGREWELMQIQLAPSSQGQGLGTSILQSVIAQAREAGAALSLCVPKASPARRLYERLGFKVVAEKAHVYDMVLALEA